MNLPSIEIHGRRPIHRAKYQFMRQSGVLEVEFYSIPANALVIASIFLLPLHSVWLLFPVAVGADLGCVSPFRFGGLPIILQANFGGVETDSPAIELGGVP